ncbi:MAG: hypothetical protein ABI705_02990 [Aestuariivirga sp.]
MQSNRDHGTGAKPQKKQAGEKHLRPPVQRDQSAHSPHPALIALVRILARQAAAECLAASSRTSPLAAEVDGHAR